MAINFGQFRQWVINPVIERLALPSPGEATDLMLSICANESLGTTYIDQHVSVAHVPGPAFGPYQFERPTINLVNKAAARDFHSPKTSAAVKASLETFLAEYQVKQAEQLHVHLDKATAYARLLLWFDPSALPPIGDSKGQYDCYLRVWRPGKPPTFQTWKSKRSKWEQGTL